MFTKLDRKKINDILRTFKLRTLLVSGVTLLIAAFSVAVYGGNVAFQSFVVEHDILNTLIGAAITYMFFPLCSLAIKLLEVYDDRLMEKNNTKNPAI